MTRLRIAAALAVAAALGASAVAAPKRAPARAAVSDWTKVVVATPEGGYRIGNPAAKVKLVEYGSVWCPHCKHFHEEGVPALKAKYIATGQVSYELRNFVLNAPDLAATLAVQCGGLPTYFRHLDAFYAGQEAWQANFFKMGQAEAERVAALPQTQQPLALARVMQLDSFVKPLGLSAAKFEQCLTNPASVAKITASNDKAVSLGLTGTPMFLINGKMVPDTSSWEVLEPALRAAL